MISLAAQTCPTLLPQLVTPTAMRAAHVQGCCSTGYSPCRMLVMCTIRLRAGEMQAAPALRSILWRLAKRALIAAAAGAATGAAVLSVAERVHALPVEGPAVSLTLADGRRLAYEVRRGMKQRSIPRAAWMACSATPDGGSAIIGCQTLITVDATAPYLWCIPAACLLRLCHRTALSMLSKACERVCRSAAIRRDSTRCSGCTAARRAASKHGAPRLLRLVGRGPSACR